MAQPAAADVGVLLEAVSVLLLALVLLALSLVEALSLAAVPPEPPLKSVAYQPEPLS